MDCILPIIFPISPEIRISLEKAKYLAKLTFENFNIGTKSVDIHRNNDRRN